MQTLRIRMKLGNPFGLLIHIVFVFALCAGNVYFV